MGSEYEYVPRVIVMFITRSISELPLDTPLPIIASTLLYLLFGDFAFIPFFLFTSSHKLAGLHCLDL
jgi:hypothetical protein